MLLMDAKGKIYDVPEEVVSGKLLKKWAPQARQILRMFDGLEATIALKRKQMVGDPMTWKCCNLYANYTPSD